MNTIAIIGGGFAGTLTAVNLIRQCRYAVKIVLIESQQKAGRGMAYSTLSEKHLLNVPAGRMSAFPDKPLHFLRWAQSQDKKVKESSFLKRSLYGEYLESILQSTLKELPHGVAFERIFDEALSIKLIQGDSKAVIKLAEGDVVVADRAVLATGNFSPAIPTGISQGIASSDKYINNPWGTHSFDFGTTSGDILLIGSGLTMVDKALEIVHSGFKGTIHAVSRRGLLPRANSRTSHPAFAQTELHSELFGDLHLLVKSVREAIKSGSYGQLFDNASTVKMDVSDWRQVIDSLRPHSQSLWQSLDDKQKRRFLRHVRAYWDVHRHRTAPEVGEEIDALVGAGKLQVTAGRLYSVQETADALIATILPREGKQAQQVKVSYMINCTGVSADFRRVKNPLAQSLLTRGIVSPHASGLGINVLPEGNVVDAQGKASNVVFTLGTPTLGTRGETTAIPELRVQAKDLAAKLLSTARPALEISITDEISRSGSFTTQDFLKFNVKA